MLFCTICVWAHQPSDLSCSHAKNRPPLLELKSTASRAPPFLMSSKTKGRVPTGPGSGARRMTPSMMPWSRYASLMFICNTRLYLYTWPIYDFVEFDSSLMTRIGYELFPMQMTQHNVGALVVVKPGEQKSIAGIITERGTWVLKVFKIAVILDFNRLNLLIIIDCNVVFGLVVSSMRNLLICERKANRVGVDNFFLSLVSHGSAFSGRC